MSDDQSERSDGGDALLADVPGAELSEDEADEMFGTIRDAVSDDDSELEEAAGETSPGEGEGDVVELPRGEGGSAGAAAGRWRRWAGLAAAAVLAVAGWVAYDWSRSSSGPVDENSGIKSPEARPEVELIPIRGRRGPDGPTVGDRLESGAALDPGDRLLFRYRLSRRAVVVLMGADEGGAPEVLWRSDGERPARESEVRSGGETLSLNPARYDGRFQLMMVAGSPDVVDDGVALETLSIEALHRRCPSCGGDVVAFRAPGSGP